MAISPLTSNTAMAVTVQALATTNALQMEVLQRIADSQMQMADLLREMGLGQTVDLMA